MRDVYRRHERIVRRASASADAHVDTWNLAKIREFDSDALYRLQQSDRGVRAQFAIVRCCDHTCARVAGAALRDDVHRALAIVCTQLVRLPVMYAYTVTTSRDQLAGPARELLKRQLTRSFICEARAQAVLVVAPRASVPMPVALSVRSIAAVR